VVRHDAPPDEPAEPRVRLRLADQHGPPDVRAPQRDRPPRPLAAGGSPPPTAPRLETVSISPIQYVLDANGNVRGGIRTPAVDAPVATLSGLGQTGTQFCGLFGTTVPLTAEQLDALYGGHGGFVAAWDRATVRAFLGGFLRPEDAFNLVVVGAQSDILR
jgi:Alpha/beta hydrolase domain